MIWNTAGTAAGIDAHYQTPDLKHNCRIFVVPGVPKEMRAMWERDVLPHVRGAAGGAVILSRTLHTYGLGESAIGEKLGNLMRRDRNPSVGTTVSEGQVSLRVNSRFASGTDALRQLEQTAAECRAVLGDLIYGQDDETLPRVVGRLLAAASQDITVAAAESCTGGLLAAMLTEVPGSSEYFSHGWVTYSEEAKQQQLGIPAELIHRHGVVSEPVAVAMARGARTRARSDVAVGITGVAGPTGGSPTAPVGTVCIALVDATETPLARTFNFPGDREMVRDRAARMALTMLRFHLLGKSLPF
jgi:nicotinamide-nucleotide amidase